MRTGNGKDQSGVGGESCIGGPEAGHDGLHSLNGGSTCNEPGLLSATQDVDAGSERSQRGDAGAVEKTSWFEPVEDNGCKDGVCPVPWLANTFLTEDRNSNFPGENTIPQRPELKPDLVNHPPHYADGGIECIEAIEAQLTSEEYRGYLKGNCAKYVWRERHKGGTESLKKARWYLDRLIEFDEN
jgi:hypothetical protein